MMFELLLLPALTGMLVALVAGPLGAFTVWRGMAYFGDTLAHSALLGVAAALVFNFNVQLGILLSCIFIAILLIVIQKKSWISSDSILGILSHSSLALGLLVISLLPGNRVNLFGWLFGDLLTVTAKDVWIILGLAILTLALVVVFWRALLMVAIDEELAQVEGKNVQALRLLLMLLMAFVVAVAMKTVGILLVTALLIIPAATAQRISRSPETMALGASLIGILCVPGGLLLSAFADTPSGPSIVICAALTFLVSFLFVRKA